MLIRITLLTLLIAQTGWGRGDTVPGSRYTSGRGAAMADAFLPLGDDGASGLFYNPAVLAKIKQPNFEPLNFQIQANGEYINNFALTDFYKVTSLKSYEPLLAANPGIFPGVSASLLPNAFIRGFAFGLLYQSRMAATERNDVVRYRSKYQLIPTVGTGIRLASGVLRLGYSLQWVNQASGDISVPKTTTPLGYNQGLAEGSGFSHTVGMALTFPIQLLPSINIVARNLFGLHYSSGSLLPLARNANGVPEDEPMSVDASFSIQPKIGNGAQFNLVAEYRDVTNRSGISVMGRAAIGAEFSFRDLFFLRAGWGSGYPSAGLGLRRKTAEFALSWFSEETGASYRSERDSRFILHYQIRVF